MAFINILLPVYNEELRLENGVMGTICFLSSIEYKDYQITIVDNASTDKTREIGERLERDNPSVKYLRLEEKGVGVAIRKGVEKNDCSVVGYMDVDLSTDVAHLKEVIEIFRKNPNVAIVNGSRLNKDSETRGRKWYRNITSFGLTFLLKLMLKMKASDSICGFKFFRRDIIENLSKETENENGWFYIIELLLRAERYNYDIVELPVRWKDDYNTTVHVGKLVKNYLENILRLRKQFKTEGIL